MVQRMAARDRTDADEPLDRAEQDDQALQALDSEEQEEQHEQDSDLEEKLEEELEEQEEEAEEKLDLAAEVEVKSACERHVTVTVSRYDIDRYFDREFSELMPTAWVPGFRPGRAPRRLVEARFRKEAAERVKAGLLTDAISQVLEQEDLSAIGEPQFDLEVIEIPQEGPLTFEFDIEVRPEFELPEWKGLRIERPVREITDEDVDRALQHLLAERGQLVPYDGPAELGDYISTKLTVKHGDRVLCAAPEEVIRIRPVLTFRDARIDGFDTALLGVRAGETREAEAVISAGAANEQLRGQKVRAIFEVQEVKRLELPELTPELLQELGNFVSEADLRDAVRDTLQRQREYQQMQRAREQITETLTAGADWELPPQLLKRQAARELERQILEMQRSGFSDEEIRAYANELRQNSLAVTARALKEHFILERIAEQEGIRDEPEDYDLEIQLIAEQTGETPRRVRARLEKSGRMDVLRNQIIERKVIDLIFSQAEFVDVSAVTGPSTQTWALDRSLVGDRGSEIPEAKPEKSSAKAK
ncbi:MAG TPA: trigger factor [Planctomycetaceae bacterium]|nr:trigger factor [Planctomycetaceae bacterium]HIQ21687.1 trigger factor [Planctomycetota bacterium]